MVKELSDGVTETRILQKTLNKIVTGENYLWESVTDNASPKPEFFLFSLFIFPFISQLI